MRRLALAGVLTWLAACGRVPCETGSVRVEGACRVICSVEAGCGAGAGFDAQPEAMPSDALLPDAGSDAPPDVPTGMDTVVTLPDVIETGIEPAEDVRAEPEAGVDAFAESAAMDIVEAAVADTAPDTVDGSIDARESGPDGTVREAGSDAEAGAGTDAACGPDGGCGDAAPVCASACGVRCGATGCSRVKEIAISHYTSCALFADGRVACWGWAPRGASGLVAPDANAGRPRLVPGVSSGQHLATSASQTCVTQASGGVLCWGNTPTRVSGSDAIVDLAMSDDAICGRTAAGTVACWGSNAQLGLGNPTGPGSLDAPAVVPGLDAVVQLVAGSQHFCARRSDGSVRCWGRNGMGPLGTGDLVDRGSPAVLASVTGARDVVAGTSHTCVLTGLDRVTCWGTLGGLVGSITPRVWNLGVEVRALRSNGAVVCALTAPSGARCWSDDDAPVLGTAPATVRSEPNEVVSFAPIQQLALGHDSGCFYDPDTDADPRCWSWGGSELVGDGRPRFRGAPQHVLDGVDEIAAGDAHTCALDVAGQRLGCWGDNQYGQLPNETGASRNRPFLRVLSGDRVSGVRARESATAVLSAGNARVWGDLAPGAAIVGDGGSPTRRSGEIAATDCDNIVLGAGSLCSERVGRAIRCWGIRQPAPCALTASSLQGSDSQCDIVTTDPLVQITLSEPGYYLGRTVTGRILSGDWEIARPRISFRSVIGFFNTTTDATWISVNSATMCVVRSNGDIGCNTPITDGWPSGNSLFASTWSPPASAQRVASSSVGACALLSTGRVACFGSQFVSEGIATAANAVVFAQPQDVVDIVGGVLHFCARTASRQVWCWGSDTSGQLGLGYESVVRTPVPIVW